MVKFCQNCGAPLEEGARFCAGCGHPVAGQSQPTQQGYPPRQPYGQPQGNPVNFQPSPRAYRPQQPKKKDGFVKALLIVALVAVLGYGGWEYYQYRHDKKVYEANTKDHDKLKEKLARQQNKDSESQGTQKVSETQLKVLETDNGSLSSESPVVTLCGVTVGVVPEMLKDGNQPITVSKKENSMDNEGIRSENYELEMGSHERFEVPVEVTFPCTIAANTDVIVEHYNGETKSWTPLFSTLDEEKQTVSAYFGSFSPARVRYIPVGKNPGIYRVVTPDEDRPFVKELWVSDNYWKILQRINPSVYSDEVTRFKDNPENYAVPFPELDPNMDLQAMSEAFTDASNLWTCLDPLINFGLGTLPEASQNKAVKFMINHSEKLGNAMNAIPFVIMGVQLASDMNYALKHPADQEAHKTVAMNLCKGLVSASGTIYSMATGFSQYGFTLAFFGVALFSLELDYFIDAAKAEQAANVEAVFDAYYRDVEPFDAYHWYQVFESAYWKYSGNADAAMEEIRDEVDAYCRKFWDEVYKETNEDLLFATTSAGYKKVFFNATEEQKQALTERQKQKVWKLIETESMEYIQRFMMERMQESTRAQLSEAVKDYNQVLHFEIEEKVDPDMTSRFLGRTICLGIDEKPFKEWYVTVPEDEDYEKGWTVDFWCSVYGYLQMGLPNQVLVYDDVKDLKAGKTPKEKMDFKAKMDGDRKTHIVLVTENPEKKKMNTKEIKGKDWICRGYDDANYGHLEGALRDAVRNTNIVLQNSGDFSASSEGHFNRTGSSYSETNDASLAINGHLDKNTGEGTFTVKAIVVYHDKSSSKDHQFTYTYDFSGDITPSTVFGFDLLFSGKGTVERKGEYHNLEGKLAETAPVVKIEEKYECTLSMQFLSEK